MQILKLTIVSIIPPRKERRVSGLVGFPSSLLHHNYLRLGERVALLFTGEQFCISTHPIYPRVWALFRAQP